MKQLLALYGLSKDECRILNYGSGLINDTWFVVCGKQQFILQKINKTVFANPELIDKNVQHINEYLASHHPAYTLVTPLPAANGETIILFDEAHYRLFKFIPSKTFPVAENSIVAFEAAKQFGAFAKNLSGFNADKLHQTIPQFHDLTLRYNQFLNAVENGNPERIHQSKKLIDALQQHRHIVSVYENFLKDESIKKRVTHHDTKISNVLFNEEEKGIAVIDLDTVMPGYFISDVGDMLRTYLSPVSEEETNLDLIEIRDEYFEAIANGYLSEMKNELSAEELNAFVYAGKFMIYMQALRFLTDYLNNDVYYGAEYPLHNYNRAQNQLRLLERLIEKEDKYNNIVKQVILQ